MKDICGNVKNDGFSHVCAAAYVNACNGYNAGIHTASDCQGMWQACASGTYWTHPVSGDRWYRSQITSSTGQVICNKGVVDFLAGTFTTT